MAKKLRKVSARDKRAIAKLAMRGLKDPASLTYGQIKRIAAVALAEITYPEPPRRGRPPQAYRS